MERVTVGRQVVCLLLDELAQSQHHLLRAPERLEDDKLGSGIVRKGRKRRPAERAVHRVIVMAEDVRLEHEACPGARQEGPPAARGHALLRPAPLVPGSRAWVARTRWASAPWAKRIRSKSSRPQ